MPTPTPITFTNPEFQLLWQAMLNAEDDLSFTHSLQSLADNIHLLYNDDAVNTLTDALFYAQMAAWNAGINSVLTEVNRSTPTIHATRKCKAKDPTRCRYHKGRIVSSELHDYSDGIPEDYSLCYLYPATAKKLLKKGFSVKDKNNKTIHFSGIIYNHIFFHKRNKDRIDRASYLLLAKDTIQKGTITKEKPRPEYNESARYNYINHYLINDKPRFCRVTVAEFFTGRREVITYHLMK